MLSARFILFPLLGALAGCFSRVTDGLDLANAGLVATDAASSAGVFFDDFDGVAIDDERWRVSYRNWGGQLPDGTSYNGGVHPDNVEFPGDGTLVLRVHGDRYEGLPRGENRDGSLRPDGKRVGAAIATASYYASGRYEVRMKVAPVDGVCSAIWSFYYAELHPGDLGYPAGDKGVHIINHEIDIELPGRPGPPRLGISRAWALMNTWIGEGGGESTIGYIDLGAPQDDGEWHTYRFDWHTDPAGVDFYVDDALVHRTEATVPTRAGRFTIGAWFPNGWAGEPDFDRSALIVDWVRITPFHGAGDEYAEETYPDSGWAD